MNQHNGKLGTREFISLILLTIGLKFTDITPSVLYPYGLTATWMFPIVSGLFVLIPFFLLLTLLKKYENKGLIELTYMLTGKYIGFVIGMLLFFFMFVITILYSRSYTDMMGTLFFPKTPTPVILFLFMFVSYFIANRGLEAVGRTSWLTVPYFKLSLVGLVVLIWTNVSVENIFPISGPGIREIIVEGTRHSFIFGEIIFFSILFPFVRNYKDFRIASLLGIVISIIELAFFYAIYLMIYDYPTIESIAFPFQQLTRIVNLGPVFGNIEALFLGFWAIASIARLAIYLYLTVAIFSFTLKLKEFEPLILPFAGVIMFAGLLPNSSIESVLILRENLLLQLNWLLIFILPIGLWVLDKVRKGRRAL